MGIDMTEQQLLKYLNDNPKHKIYVDIDNSGQLIIYTGLQIVDEGFSPIDEEGE